jgi:hypothetical protein
VSFAYSFAKGWPADIIANGIPNSGHLMQCQDLNTTKSNLSPSRAINHESRDAEDCSWRVGLFLRRRANDRRIWIQHIKIGGQKREIFLGEFPNLSMAEARKISAANRHHVEAGTDILSKQRQENHCRLRNQINGFSDKTDQSAKGVLLDTSINPLEQPNSGRMVERGLPPLDFGPYAIQPTLDIDLKYCATPKSHFAQLIEKIVTLEETSTIYEALDTPIFPEFLKPEQPAAKPNAALDQYVAPIAHANIRGAEYFT